MEIPERNLDIATIELVEPKTKMYSFTTEVLGVKLYIQILCYDNCFFVVINQNNRFSSLSVAMSQRNSIDTICSTILSIDPDCRSESIANTLIKKLKTSIPIYVSFNADIETIGLKDVISSLINFFKSHPEIGIC